MGWFYSTKYWKYSSVIFPDKSKRKFLEFKEGYNANFREYYNISRKAILYRRVMKDFLNLALDKVSEGNIVALDNGVTLYLKNKRVPTMPYKDFIDILAANDELPYIYMNTGEMIKKNDDFLVIPSKSIKKKLLDFNISGAKYTKLIDKYFK